MIKFYSRVPRAAVHQQPDGNLYAHIPHRLDVVRQCITEDHANLRMLRFDRSSFYRDGFAFVWFASAGAGVGIDLGALPADVLAIEGVAA